MACSKFSYQWIARICVNSKGEEQKVIGYYSFVQEPRKLFALSKANPFLRVTICLKNAICEETSVKCVLHESNQEVVVLDILEGATPIQSTAYNGEDEETVTLDYCNLQFLKPCSLGHWKLKFQITTKNKITNELSTISLCTQPFLVAAPKQQPSKLRLMLENTGLFAFGDGTIGPVILYLSRKFVPQVDDFISVQIIGCTKGPREVEVLRFAVDYVTLVHGVIEVPAITVKAGVLNGPSLKVQYILMRNGVQIDTAFSPSFCLAPGGAISSNPLDITNLSSNVNLENQMFDGKHEVTPSPSKKIKN